MRKRLLEFLVLLSVAIGAAPATSAIWQWSTTAGSNATADPSINWSEGMSPSSVNDSARAMMSVLAAWRNDISAVNTTAGTSTAYTLTTSEGLNTTPATGQMISFIAHADNGASPTLRVDGGNAYALKIGGASAPSGTMIAGNPYRVAFDGTNWLLEAGYGNPYSIPLGGLLPSTSPNAPNSSFIEPAGQCISTTTYAAYWAQQGSPASGGCPGGQFAVIDMRGRVPAALDTLNASSAFRLTNSATGCGTAMTTVGAVCANGTESRSLITANLPPYTPSGSISGTGTSTSAIIQSNSSNITVSAGGANTVPLTSNTSVQINGNQYVFSGNAQGGSSLGIPMVQPTIGVKYYLRVL